MLLSYVMLSYLTSDESLVHIIQKVGITSFGSLW